MLRIHSRILRTLALLSLLPIWDISEALAQIPSSVSVHLCPYDCTSLGLGKSECRDWREGALCYVEDLRRKSSSLPGYKFCIRTSNGSIKVRKRCSVALGETEIAFDELRGDQGLQGLTGEQGEAGPQGETGLTGPQGPAGPTGAQGATGPQGPVGSTGAPGTAGSDGTLRIYGDGSAGGRSIVGSVTLNDPNPQYTNFTIASGSTLTVHSGTVIRCTGSFQNEGTISVNPALRDHPRFGENGVRPSTVSSGGLAALGGTGGLALYSGVARQLLKLGILGGGNGFRESADTGGDGGGNFAVLCAGGVVNQGSISAHGTGAPGPARGGGGGGFILLASGTSVSNSGALIANGGAGGALLATDSNSTGFAAGGGGGGGIVHLIAPSATNSGSITVNGGAGGSAGGAGSISGFVYLGGGSGGGSGGAGGDGGTVNPGNIGNDSTTAGGAGAQGLALTTTADPAALW
jgi:hypothetical protein